MTEDSLQTLSPRPDAGGGRDVSGFPGRPDPSDNVALTPYASHKSGEYFQTQFYPFLACPQGHLFLLFSSWSPVRQRQWWVEHFWAQPHTTALGKRSLSAWVWGQVLLWFLAIQPGFHPCTERQTRLLRSSGSLSLSPAPLRKRKKDESNHLPPPFSQVIYLKHSELDTSGLEMS